MSSKLDERIDFELNQIRHLLKDAQQIIISSKKQPPDTISCWALGAMLHAFYNGIENILKQILTAFDRKPEKSERWHADLLIASTQATEKRPALISDTLFVTLKKYLGFRHLFRSIYTHELRWESMEDLVDKCDSTFSEFEIAVNNFLETVNEHN